MPKLNDNCSRERKEGENIKYIVLHDVKFNFDKSIEIFNQLGVGAHYYIANNGLTHKLADPQKVVFHAGQSQYRSDTSLNRYSIGIETESTWSYEVSNEQLNSIVKLVKELQETYQVPSENIVSHAQIAPYRVNPEGKLIPGKTDPGMFFPWDKLAKEDIGYFPNIDKDKTPEIVLKFGDHGDKVSELQNSLYKLGYTTTPSDGVFEEKTACVLTAHYLRYYPEWFKINQESIRQTIIESKTAEYKKNNANSEASSNTTPTLEELAIEHVSSNEINDQWLFNNHAYLSAINFDSNAETILGDLSTYFNPNEFNA
jgi:N-acetyl-anhydromuramyl-L-alanine amidase AmpD